MTIPRFCPICGNILQLIEHTTTAGAVYWQWECPEGDWFEPTSPPQASSETDTPPASS